MKITSTNNPLIKDRTKLHQKKYREQFGLFLVEGYHLYEEAKKANRVEQVFTTDDSILGENVVHVSDAVLEKLAKTKNPQPVITVCKKQEEGSLANKILLLDHIQDPGNIGTLMRSAVAFGFTTLVLDETVDPYNDKVLRSTQGAIFKLNFVYADVLEFMNDYDEYTYFGAVLNGTPLDEIRCPYKIGLILGNEGAGLSQDVIDRTTVDVTIPMNNTESLNVGVAGGILMYHMRDK